MRSTASALRSPCTVASGTLPPPSSRAMTSSSNSGSSSIALHQSSKAAALSALDSGIGARRRRAAPRSAATSAIDLARRRATRTASTLAPSPERPADDVEVVGVRAAPRRRPVQPAVVKPVPGLGGVPLDPHDLHFSHCPTSSPCRWPRRVECGSNSAIAPSIRSPQSRGVEPHVVLAGNAAHAGHVGLALEVVELDRGQVPVRCRRPRRGAGRARSPRSRPARSAAAGRPPPRRGSRSIIMQAAVTAGTGRATFAAGKLRCRPLKQWAFSQTSEPGRRWKYMPACWSESSS